MENVSARESQSSVAMQPVPLRAGAESERKGNEPPLPPGARMPLQESRSRRVTGLDSLRFVCALWVFLYHWGASVDRRIVEGAWGALFCGPAAVIVFFVISGFCIHYPFQAQTGDFPTFSFLIRRYLRVGVPLGIAWWFAPTFPTTVHLFIDAVGWSIIIELIFYSIYPFMRFPVSARRWPDFLFCFFVLAGLVVIYRGRPMDYGSWGHEFNWLLALPCWLLGVCLAATYNPDRPRLPARTIWFWRGFVWLASALCVVLRYRAEIGYPWTLNLFSIPVFFWIRAELTQSYAGPISRFLEWGGQWSYSIYLMHGCGLRLIKSWPDWPGPNWLQRPVEAAFVLGVCYLFYLFIEKPSHRMARQAAILVRRLEPTERKEMAR